MSQEEFIQAIKNILGTNNELRKQSEESLKNYREQCPNEFITTICNLLKSSSEQNIRSFAVIQLRKNLSVFSEKSYSNLWNKISEDTKTVIKQVLLVSLEGEDSQQVRHQIADTIGEIGGNLIEMNNNQWPELPQAIWSMLANHQNHIIENGLKILGVIFSYASDYFLAYKQQLHTVFQQGMMNAEDNIRLATIEAFCSLIEVVEFKDAKFFENLCELLLKSSFELIQKNPLKGDQVLSNLSNICESEPKFLKRQLQLFIDLMYQITFNKQLGEEGLKRTATESSLQLVEKLPNALKDQKENLNKVIEMIFAHMVEIPAEITDEWQKPAEGYNEDVDQNSDMENVRYGTNGIDRIISAVGEKETLPLLSSIVQKMLMQADWRYKHAAIMALSQVGEYIEDINEIVPIVSLVMSYISDQNPKIRYSVCHCIGQIADDMVEFQEKFHQSVLPVLIGLMDDPVPRVQSHAAAAITNFVEGMDKELTNLYLNEIIVKSFEKLKDGICIVKETVISAIAATSESAKEHFKQYYTEGAHFLLQMLSTHSGPAYRQLRGQIIECVTLMSHAVGKEAFKPILGFLIKQMLEIQENQLAHVDPQKQYLLAAWQRICLILQKDFAEYLPQVLPSIFKLMNTVLEEQTEFSEKRLEINTSATEEAEIAMHMLNVIIDETKEMFIPYIEKASQIILPLLSFSTNESIRASACKCLPKLIGSIKSKDLQSAISCSKIFLGALWSAVQEEIQATVIYDQVHAISECFKEIGEPFLTADEMSQMEKKVLQMLMDSDKRKTDNEELKKTENNDDELDEDDKEMFEIEILQEEDLHLAIADLIGILLFTHPDQSLQIYNIILTQLLPKVLQPQISPKLQQFGIQLIVYIINGLKYQAYESRIPEFLDVFIKYSQHEKATLRKISMQGIGKLALKVQSNQQVVTTMTQAVLQAISSAPAKPKEFDFSYNSFRDNAVSALGKIIQFHSSEINFAECYQIWIDHLPLKNDRMEAIYQHDFLLNLLANQLNAAIGNQGQNLPKIVKILAGILEIKSTPKTLQLKVQSMFKTFKSNELIQKHWTQITSILTDNQKKKIEELENIQIN